MDGSLSWRKYVEKPQHIICLFSSVWHEPTNVEIWGRELFRGSFLFDIGFFQKKSLGPESEMKGHRVEIKRLKRACIQSFVECPSLPANIRTGDVLLFSPSLFGPTLFNRTFLLSVSTLPFPIIMLCHPPTPLVWLQQHNRCQNNRTVNKGITHMKYVKTNLSIV